VTDRPLTLMAVHAHPDDEVTGTGGVLAKYAAEGLRTVLVTCTDGSCGDGPGGVKPGEPGHDPAAVAALRRVELEASCAILNVSNLELLGYPDSGMVGWPTNDAPGSFWSTPVDEAAARLVGLIEQYEPDVIVTYDANGFYGHPDHIQAHRVTMAAVAAVRAAGRTIKVYWTTIPRSGIEEFGRVMRELGADWEEPDLSAAEDAPVMGLPDEEVTTWVDAREFGGQKFDALAAHASQSENIFFLRMGRERLTEMMGIETFVLIPGTDDIGGSRATEMRVGAPVEREDDLFAGLR
jgi:LmbE family N-acetylglucosaminyl deacetylase